jgi:hypothetical protein
MDEDEGGWLFAPTPRVLACAQMFDEADEFGPLHIVVSDGNLDDGNLDDGNIKWCLTNTEPRPVTASERRLCAALLKMNGHERWTTYVMAGQSDFSQTCAWPRHVGRALEMTNEELAKLDRPTP